MADQVTAASQEKAQDRTGGCLCGAVTFKVATKDAHADACHCGMCQKWSAGPAFSVQCATEPELSGHDDISIYKGSDWGERWFCKTCGSNLFWRAPAYGYIGVSVGALDDKTDLTFASQIYIDRKPDLYSFADPTRTLTEAEFEQMLAQIPQDQQHDG